jgi:hypothetical protein
MHWTKRSILKERIAEELQKRGWELYDFIPHESDPDSDFYSWGNWSGLATHADHPGIVIAIMPPVFNMLDGQTTGLIIVNPLPSTDVKPSLPPYSMNPKGCTWHIEDRFGDMIKSGKIPNGVGTQWDKEAPGLFVDRLEAIVKKQHSVVS